MRMEIEIFGVNISEQDPAIHARYQIARTLPVNLALRQFQRAKDEELNLSMVEDKMDTFNMTIILIFLHIKE